MLRLINSLSSPLISLFLFVGGSAFFTTIISLRMRLEGFNASTIGYIHSAFYLGYLIGSARIEKFIRSFGHIRAFSALSGMTLTSLMLQGLNGSPYLWAITRCLTGVSIASLFVVIESWLLAKSDTRNRGRILAVYMFILYFSQTTSQTIVQFVNPLSSAPFFIAALLAALAILPVSMTRTASPMVEEPSIKNLFSVFKISPSGAASCLIAGFILSSIYSFTPLFAQKYNLNVSAIMSITIAGGFLLQWPIGKLSDIFDRRKVLTFVSVAAVVPSIMLMIGAHNAKFVFAVSFLLGGLVFTIYPLGISQVCDRAEDKEVHSIVGLLSILYSLGAIIGPLIAPLFMALWGTSALYLYIAVIALVLFAIGIYSIFQRPPIAKEDQGSYSAILPRAMPTTSAKNDLNIL